LKKVLHNVLPFSDLIIIKGIELETKNEEWVEVFKGLIPVDNYKIKVLLTDLEDEQEAIRDKKPPRLYQRQGDTKGY